MREFMLIGLDASNNTLSGPIAKRKFSSNDEAGKHAVEVLKSGGNQNLSSILIVETVAVARRVSAPIEIVPIPQTEDADKVFDKDTSTRHIQAAE